MGERDAAVGQVVEGLLRRAGGPVREVVLYERARAEIIDLVPEELIGVLEALAARGRLVALHAHVQAAAGRDPEPFQPRFWRVTA